MSGYISIALFILGFVPYCIIKEQKGKVLSFELRAFYWSFTRRRDTKGDQQWRIRLLIIERLRGAIWAVIDYWRKETGSDV